MDYKEKVIMDSSDFVLLSDYVPGIVQEIRYYSTYNFVGDRIDGYEEPVAILSKAAARAISATVLCRGISSPKWPMQPRNRPCLCRETKAPHLRSR